MNDKEYQESIESTNELIDRLCVLAEKIKDDTTEKEAIKRVVFCLMDYKLILSKIKCGVKPYANIE